MEPAWLKEYGDSVVGVAIEAGLALLKRWRQDGLVVEQKVDDSPVTQADRESQAIIVAGLRSINADAQIVREEWDDSELTSIQVDQPYWLIDPLDGTKEFISGSEEFVVCMGYVEQGVATWGLIHCPVSGVTVVGAAGYNDELGAWECGTKGVWRSIQAEYQGDSGLFLGSAHSASIQEQAVLDQLKHKGIDVVVQPMGSALKFIEIAKGCASGYLRYGPTCSWDVAAGQAIVQGAGGAVFDWSGRTLSFNSQHGARNPSFVCLGRSGALQQHVLEAVQLIGGRPYWKN